MYYTQIKTLKKLCLEQKTMVIILFLWLGINGFKQWITNKKVFLIFQNDYNG